nr:helix-turn-helix domain-containing protein [Frankia gtarii]
MTFTPKDRVRDVIHNFNADGFDSLGPKYSGDRPRKFTLPECWKIKTTVISRRRSLERHPVGQLTGTVMATLESG